ncbi:Iron-sulfur assembly protein IscA, chloroplastic [Tetrabaena socialis]|uniref:Iron-sulfur assembly protein IscA, chloroplastic n=1 Tax=Tetrabaena socialis TaxID=47790 RepID=A0A2J7ZS20_9CHLO|nr:Iron-sulfur assembly protein IscA, chloroplastic [Tetrabaena socialis]|eukprot:PNH03069.1 Iron-sulfur assembly protein IscA, chloroplastic [Tetrabaena socialis]
MTNHWNDTMSGHDMGGADAMGANAGNGTAPVAMQGMGMMDCDGFAIPERQGNWQGHVFPGSIFIFWATHWFISASWRHITATRAGRAYRTQSTEQLLPMIPALEGFNRYPAESLLKTVCGFLLFLLQITYGNYKFLICPDGVRMGRLTTQHLNSWGHGSMNLGFSLSGLVELLGLRSHLPEGTNHLKKLRAEHKNEEQLLLRVGVKQGGCSGMSYVMDFEGQDKVSADDHVMAYEEGGGFQLVVDPKSLLYLFGMRLGFSNALIGGGFQFQNPRGWEVQRGGPGAERALDLGQHVILSGALLLEALLFSMHEKNGHLDQTIHFLLAQCCWAGAVFAALEAAYPQAFLLTAGRAASMLLQGTWFCQTARVLFGGRPIWDDSFAGREDEAPAMFLPMVFVYHVLLVAAAMVAVYAGLEALHVRLVPSTEASGVCGGDGRGGLAGQSAFETSRLLPSEDYEEGGLKSVPLSSLRDSVRR